METLSIKKGAWVKIVNHLFLTGFTGYVFRIDPIDDNYKIMLTSDPKGRPTKGNVWIDFEQLLLYGNQNEHDEDAILSMIDLALDMNDKEWFLELNSKLPIRG
jgi:hypothetical protein